MRLAGDISHLNSATPVDVMISYDFSFSLQDTNAVIYLLDVKIEEINIIK